MAPPSILEISKLKRENQALKESIGQITSPAEKLLEHQTQPSLYECPECHLKYKEKEWAEKCETWCRDNHSCNLEITAHAEK